MDPSTLFPGTSAIASTLLPIYWTTNLAHESQPSPTENTAKSNNSVNNVAHGDKALLHLL